MIDLTSPRVQKTKTMLSLPTETLNRMRSLAKHHGISMSEYLTRVVEADLAERSNTTPLNPEENVDVCPHSFSPCSCDEHRGRRNYKGK
jgi:hypothetical protein